MGCKNGLRGPIMGGTRVYSVLRRDTDYEQSKSMPCYIMLATWPCTSFLATGMASCTCSHIPKTDFHLEQEMSTIASHTWWTLTYLGGMNEYGYKFFDSAWRLFDRMLFDKCWIGQPW